MCSPTSTCIRGRRVLSGGHKVLSGGHKVLSGGHTQPEPSRGLTQRHASKGCAPLM